MARSRIFVLAVLVLALAALPAAAETYTVTLTNGTAFLSRYQPQESSWDSGTVLLLTDVGNWMAVPRGEIESITAESEVRGFGLRIDATTLVFGWAPNDNPEEDETAPAQRDPFSSLDRFLNRSYDIQQFVEPGEAGGGGVPVFGVTYSGGGGGQAFGGTGGAPPSTPPPPQGGGGQQ